MKKLFIAAALATTFLTPVSAAEYRAQSAIDAVTVYPRGAEITRLANLELEEGDHTLTLDNLPGTIDPHSIRVEGLSSGGLQIASVDSKTVHVSDDEATAGERRRIESQIEALRDRHAALDQLIADATYQKKLLQELATKPFSLQGNGDKPVSVSSDEFGNMFDLVSARLTALSKTVLDANIQKREVSKDISELQNTLSELAPKQRVKTVVTVHLTSAAAGEGQFKLRYKIAEAGWQPYYEARLDSTAESKSDNFTLVRRAEVTQHTSETWNDVKLTLSTARPTGSTSAPEIHPEIISLVEERRKRETGVLNMMSPRSADEKYDESDVLADRPAPAQMLEAEAVMAGFQALYAIQGRVDVDNAGTAKKVRISSDEMSAQLAVQAVPKLDTNAYLTANFTLDGEAPLLRGRVMLFRDGVYMGNGVLPTLSPGEDHRLGFGVDDLVKVERVEVKRQTSETGLISTDTVDERSWAITVKNLHDQVMPVTIFDQLPYSTHEDIEVELLTGSTRPTERNVEKKRGVLAWTYEMEPNKNIAINFGYRITRPENVEFRVGWN